MGPNIREQKSELDEVSAKLVTVQRELIDLRNKLSRLSRYADELAEAQWVNYASRDAVASRIKEILAK